MSDLAEFRKIVDQQKERLYRLAYRLAGNHQDAEDLSQEVFIKVYKNMDSFRGESQLSTWLYRITVNTWIDKTRLKRNSSETVHVDYEDERQVKANPFDAPEDYVQAEHLQSDIDRALNLLSNRERTVFVLKHYQQLKFKEIAKIMEVSTGTAKSTMFRAMQKLRDALKEYKELG
ncbi:MAG: sigma-70 family RNA polymerase sigma factor [Candidatus Marinimicrobia bacterium]|nr:sigma-70 family RNA polymerase sigma factor [Candidatus Neomarinimicrobiota bacterium]